MTTPNLQPTTVTYGDLVDGDIIVDKSGNHWPVSEVNVMAGSTSFWLGKPKAHLLNKATTEEVTVLRPQVETHAEELARREVEVVAVTVGRADAPEPTEDEVVETFTKALGAEVVAEESAAESDARRTAEATGEPVTLPTFEEMTDLEKRSHLYLIHGVYAADVKFREKLVELHEEAHAGDADRVPHIHTEGAEVSS